MPTSHISEPFNEEVQVEFLYACIHGKRREILNIVDVGTRYGERSTSSRNTGEIRNGFETQWLYIHGVPKRMSADHEFCRPVLQKYLDVHDITLNPRHSPRSNKCGRVERKSGVFKSALKLLRIADQEASADLLIARSSFLTNVL